ncbi:hypothetical protein MCETHM1_01290 [Flavobacteriaceae bacterium]
MSLFEILDIEFYEIISDINIVLKAIFYNTQH